MTGIAETQGERVVRMLGGRLAARDITGYPLTTIDSWLKRGTIRQNCWVDIVVKANAAGVRDFTIFHFIAHMVTLTEERSNEQRA